MKHIRIIFTFVALLVCGPQALMAQQAAETPTVENSFAFDLYARYAASDDNVFFSPYSLSSALQMTYEGAKGTTADEMRSVLHLSSDDAARQATETAFIEAMNAPGKPYEISVANAIWVEKTYPLLEEFTTVVENVYFAEANNVNFITDPDASRITINNWVSEKTKTRIQDLLPPNSINGGTRLVLTNAVYFKAKWVEPFKPELTQKADFHLTPKDVVPVDMMSQDGTFLYMGNEMAQVLELPYQGEDLSMFIVLPRVNDIKACEAAFDQNTLRQWTSTLKGTRVALSLPKFKVAAEYKLKKDLIELGMKAAFSNADFSGMTGEPDLFIAEVYHKAWVAVDEDGTEAAAATAVVMEAGSMPSAPEAEFYADHPFIFFIQEKKTGQILFMGRVMDPTK